MSDDFAVQRYTDADRSDVFDLLRAAFSETYANHLKQLWTWKYDSHPLNREALQVRRAYRRESWAQLAASYSPELLAQWGVSLEDLDPPPEDAPQVLLLRHRNRLAAMVGALPQAFLIDGKRRLVTIGCDLAVHPEFRGMNLSMRISTRLGIEHGLVYGCSNQTSRKVGNRWTRKVSRELRDNNPSIVGTARVITLVKPIDWSYMMRRTTSIKLPGNIVAVLAAGAHRVSNPFEKPATGAGAEVFRLESFDVRIDDLWLRASREHAVIAIRDSAYLNWRFHSRPDANYVCIAAADGARILGYLVYRIVERDGARWGYIVDFLSEGDPAVTFALLVGRAEELMTRDGVKAIVCFIAKAPFRQALRRAGFYPSMFAPRSYLTAAVVKAEPRLRPFAEVQKWFVTMADGDAEMVF